MRTSKWVLFFYALVLCAGALVALPNALTPAQLAHYPNWLPHKQVTLGLDLQGGAHLVLEVDAATLKADRLKALQSDARDTLRAARIAPTTAQIAGDTLRVTFADAAAAKAGLAALQPLAEMVGPQNTSDLVLAADGNAVVLSQTQAGLDARLSRAIEQSLEIVRQRVDRVGVSEPTIQRVGGDRILVQLPGLQDPSRLRELLGSTAQMSFHMVAPMAAGPSVPPGYSILPGSDGPQTYVVEDKVALSGERLKDSRASFDSRTGKPVVTFSFDAAGTRAFADITKAHVGQPFAIVLDGKVLSAPVIQEAITGGAGQISGQFTVDDTVVLSALLRAGALPAPLTVIEERTVGPDLGADVIDMGVSTGLTGFALVCVFMVLLYRGWGMVANLALGLNVVLTMAILTLTGAALTLPGIAGIVLGLGLAVDANILINERIREELRRGAKPMTAMEKGFKQAYATIVDANVTSLIATALLFLFGSGPVKGFAITMMLGVVVSMFTAVTVVRIVMTEWAHGRRLKSLNLEPLFRFAPDRTHFSFMRARYLGIGLSLLLSAGSVGLFLSPGLNYGIDFKGGIQVEIANPAPVDLDQLRATLGAQNLGEVVLQNIGGAENVLIRVQRQDGGEAAQTKAVETLRTAVAGIYPDVTFVKAEVVGPKVSGELARNGAIAVVLASLSMLVYIWLRFEWHFAMGAIITLVLDTTKAVGFFAITGLDFNLTAIAALLTIIGYSLNDKVVVYDRMRENLHRHSGMPLREVIDLSINQVFVRCIYTSVATLVCILPMAIWGGSAVENFAIPVVFGVIVATTSSIYIAAPILLFLGNWWDRKQAGASEPLAPAKALAPGE